MTFCNQSWWYFSIILWYRSIENNSQRKITFKITKFTDIIVTQQWIKKCPFNIVNFKASGFSLSTQTDFHTLLWTNQMFCKNQNVILYLILCTLPFWMMFQDFLLVLFFLLIWIWFWSLSFAFSLINLCCSDYYNFFNTFFVTLKLHQRGHFFWKHFWFELTAQFQKKADSGFLIFPNFHH